VLNKAKRPDHWFWTRYSLYPYVGCQHGCAFCYCREQKYAPYEDIADFNYVIKVKQNAPALLRRALSRAPVDTIFTGDYQPAERKFGLSRQILEICLEFGFPVFILERSPLVLRDLDLLQEINKKTHATVAFSVIHTSASQRAQAISRLERLAPAPEKRFEAMRTLSAAGIRTGICLMPILPGLCDDDQNLAAVIGAAADAGGRFVLASSLTLADQQKTWFLDALKDAAPDLLPRYNQLYPPQAYAPAGDAWRRLGGHVRSLCQKAGIADRQPRPLIAGEKRALNKRAVEWLAEKTYTLELEGAPQADQWLYRKAAWALEDLPQELGLLYRQMGAPGLAAIPGVGARLAGELERFIRTAPVI
jgi:DNA repair photolyase